MLSISTAFFNLRKINSWRKLLNETHELGFFALELNVETPADFLPEIERSVAKGEIKISSLHNYCPRLENLPAGRTIFSGYLPTSDDENERQLALKYTRLTIEWAGRLGASAVVLHAGEVPTDPSGREFFRYIEQFGHEGKLYDQYKNALLEDRLKKAGVYMDRLTKFLDEILPDASRAGIIIGIENRFFIHEIPNISEVQLLLDRFSGRPLAYWHDTGHAEVFVRQKWTEKHEDYLKPFLGRTAGVHLHDLRALNDHFAPGSGDFDFSSMKQYLAGVPLKVVEAHSKSTPDEVKRSIEYLKKAGLLSASELETPKS